MTPDPSVSGDPPEASPRHPVIGIGCSAGSLEPLRQVLRELSDDLPATVVVVQHMSGEAQEELLVELLRQVTGLPVERAEDGSPLAPGCVILAPAHRRTTIAEGVLRIGAVDRGASDHPIDTFFGSLGAGLEYRAVAVVLSGGGSDGAAGARTVAASGGLVLVQDPSTAEFPSMPRAAIERGAGDLILTPSEIGGEIERFALARASESGDEEAGEFPEERLARIFPLLREHSGIDFSAYKRGTFRRRLQRRILIRRSDGLDAYLDLLRREPSEARALAEDVLIDVTCFFRGSASFEALKKSVLPAVCARKEGGIRVWVAGCATGEEAYSVAITIVEFLAEQQLARDVQIFATDANEAAIQRARAGVYPAKILNDLTPERLERFFSPTDGGFRIAQRIRDLCIFSRHDLTRDPPFSHLDLIVCRNVLIYMQRPLQERLAQVFHYALRPNAFLMLGHSEALSRADLFTPVDKSHRILARKGAGVRLEDLAPLGQRRDSGRVRATVRASAVEVRSSVDRLLLERYAPAAVLVDADGRILQSRGDTSPYLRLPSGTPRLDLTHMARGTLPTVLRSQIAEAEETGLAVTRNAIRTDLEEAPQVDIEVRPMRGGEGSRYLVIFEANRDGRAPSADEQATAIPGEPEPGEVEELRSELQQTRQQMSATIQDLEIANEELLSANEEILSSNEELQSTNEELDSAKEELQSTNEELSTLNDELQSRNELLKRAHSDLMNLLRSVDLPIVIVDEQLRVRRYTPTAEEALNLRPGDIDRPLTHIKTAVEVPDLERLVHKVVEEVVMVERDLQNGDGAWFSLRIRPYKNVDDRIEGAVIALFDIDDAKKQQAATTSERDFSESVLASLAHPLLVLNHQLTIEMANAAFRDLFRLRSVILEGRELSSVANGAFDSPQLQERLDRILLDQPVFEEHQLQADIPGAGSCELAVSGRLMPGDARRPDLILLAIDGIREPEPVEPRP